MTLTKEDRKNANASIGTFSAQDELAADLPNAIYNMLKELSERVDISELALSERKIRDLCGHKSQMGSYSLNINARLTQELSEFEFEAIYEEKLAEDDLKEIISANTTSLPIVELAGKYFDSAVGYTIQHDSSEARRDLYVVVMEMNHDSTLLYDPYYSYTCHSNSETMKVVEIGKKEFMKSWLGDWELSNALWITQTDQTRLVKYK